jgi:hypothetical protein
MYGADIQFWPTLQKSVQWGPEMLISDKLTRMNVIGQLSVAQTNATAATQLLPEK